MSERIMTDYRCEDCDTKLYEDEYERLEYKGYCEDCVDHHYPEAYVDYITSNTNKTKGENTMNSYKIYDGNTPKEDVFFKLVQDGSGGVTLQAVKTNGMAFPSGNILTLTRAGTLLRHGGVNKNIGLQFDTTGKIKLI